MNVTLSFEGLLYGEGRGRVSARSRPDQL